MISLRTRRTGQIRPVRHFSVIGAVAALGLAAAPLPLTAFEAAAQTHSAKSQSANTVADFYAARSGRPLWLGSQGQPAQALLQILESASIDGLDPGKYEIDALNRAIRSARKGNPKAVRRADAMLSDAFVSYVRDLRRPGTSSGIVYVDSELQPSPPSPRSILEAAAAAPSLDRFVADMGWMHPLYGEIRKALVAGSYSPDQRGRILLNLQRARELPAPYGKHILVNAAAQRLYMYEGGNVVDSMRVVVGKPKYPTPMMAALVRFANLNPYWYVPSDLAAERIAPNVVRLGSKYLDRQGYEVVSGFVGTPEVIDPSTIDWQAVADGTKKILIRQLPGPYNSMGRIKFMFPNHEGVYLHDNPERELFEQAARLYSGGCVRLESAWKLSQWLFGRELTWKGAQTEEKVPLDKPVPVYITYLTTVPDGSELTFLDDVYSRDEKRVAASQGASSIAAN